MFEKVNQLRNERDYALNNNFMIKENLEIVKRNNLTISRSNKGLIIKPKSSPLLPEEEYPFEIINYGEKDIEITMTSTYRNPKGKGIISLKSESTSQDILKYNRGKKFKIPAKSSVSFAYDIKQKRSSDSWLTAATIIIR